MSSKKSQTNGMFSWLTSASIVMMFAAICFASDEVAFGGLQWNTLLLLIGAGILILSSVMNVVHYVAHRRARNSEAS